jgi:hypothetical protein
VIDGLGVFLARAAGTSSIVAKRAAVSMTSNFSHPTCLGSRMFLEGGREGTPAGAGVPVHSGIV